LSGVRARAAQRPSPTGNKPAPDTVNICGDGAAGTVRWTVKVDTVTDALLRMHIAHNPGTDIDALVERAVNRELDRLAIIEDERRSTFQPLDDMWSITIPRPR
jgi:hypothetical protein